MKAKEKISNFFQDIFSIEENRVANAEIKANIKSGAKLKGANMCILILAIIIACVGLNMNSSEIIIGAMLISPMMGPIMGIAYALATDDLKFFRRAFVALCIQIVISVITSAIYFLYTPISSPSTALLARTRPTVWDVIIAIAGGLAGGIGLTRKEKGNIIPGVAIATGLIPPLCTAGFGIASFQGKYLLGALYLFFINAFFICVSAIIVFKLMKMPKKKGETAKEEKMIKRNLIIIAIITVIPSIILAYQIANESMIKNNAQKYIDNEFKYEGTQVVKSDVDVKNKKIQIALIGKVLDQNEILYLTNRLKIYDLEEMNLKITQTEIAEGISKESVEKMIQSQMQKTESATDIKSTTKEKIEDVKEKATINFEETKEQVKKRYSQVKECTITNNQTVSSGNLDTNTSVIVTIVLKEALTPEENQEMNEFLKTKLGEEVVINKKL